MTEKEFLLEFINEIEAFTDIIFDKDETERGIDLFLEAHHKEYFEVDFVKKDIEEIRRMYARASKNNTEEENIKLSHMCQCEICDPQL